MWTILEASRREGESGGQKGTRQITRLPEVQKHTRWTASRLGAQARGKTIENSKSTIKKQKLRVVIAGDGGRAGDKPWEGRRGLQNHQRGVLLVSQLRSCVHKGPYVGSLYSLRIFTDTLSLVSLVNAANIL